MRINYAFFIVDKLTEIYYNIVVEKEGGCYTLPPNIIMNSVDVWIKELNNRQHLEAVKYIEENVDLIDTNLQKFMDDCPSSCQLEVYAMLLKAGIDMKGYIMNDTLKKWDMYIHDLNPVFQDYVIDYIDDYIKETQAQKLPEGTLLVFYS